MKCLNDNITFSVSFGSNTPTGIYTYYLYEQSTSSSSENVFVGNVYLEGTTSKTIDCTDIIRSRKESFDIDSRIPINAKLVKKYFVQIKINSSYFTSSTIPVAMIYKYPNESIPYTTDDGIYYADSGSALMTTPLQGYTRREVLLIPHYPFQTDEEGIYNVSQTFIIGSTASSFRLNVRGAGDIYNEYVTVSTPSSNGVPIGAWSMSIAMPVDNLIDWTKASLLGNKDVTIYNGVGSNKSAIAILDRCFKRYYLQWQDRLGGIQSQAFSDNILYSEDITNDEVQNFSNTRKKSTIEIQPKWKLSSGWIKEDVFPYYESILVSPFVRLYDAEQSIIYDVIVNGNFTEKTYKTEKKLLNLTLELESTKKQNIIY